MKNKSLENVRTIVSYVFVLLVVVFGFSGVARASTPTVTIGSQSAVNRATINVPLTASNFANTMSGMDFPVQYNNTLLTYTSFTLGAAFSGHSNPTTNNFVVSGSTSEFRLNWFDTTALTLDTGTLITLHFTVISATNTTANLTFTGSTLTPDLSNILGNTITSSFVPGAITLNATSYTSPGGTGLITNYVPPTITLTPPVIISTTATIPATIITLTQTICPLGHLFSITTGLPCTSFLTTIANPSTYNFGITTLKLGSKGNAVKELQRFLNDKLNLGLVLDGKLGPKTIAVIKQWQKDHNLVADGLIGPKTKVLMNTWAATR